MKIFSRIVFSILFIMISIYTIAYLLPAPSIGLDHSLEMYDKNNELFYSSANDHYGTYIPLEEVSSNFTDAVISIEDKHFYNHIGFDFVGITRAIFSNLTSGKLSQGASTISQQYVKNLFLSNERTWERKIKEAWLTIRIETHYKKEEILEGYVNALYFGDGIYGIENAAHYFFGKSADQLTVLEGSMLAGMINGPELYSPYRAYDLTKSRQQLVLQAMYQNDMITESEFNSFTNKDTTLKVQEENDELSTIGYFRQYIYEQLDILGFDEYDGTLKIYTTLDTDLQKEITEATNQIIEDDLQASCVILEPNSGAIRVMIGGKNYQNSQYNRALYASRQMASTIKPILYYEAMNHGLHPLSPFISEPTTFYLDHQTTYSPINYNNKYPNKEITMLQAIASSDNIYAVKTHLFLGVDTLATRLEKLGCEANPTASLALGTCEISPFELCNIYNCIASKGEAYEPYAIEKIQNNNKIVYSHQIESTKKLDETLCLVLSQLMTATFSSVLEGTMRYYQTESTFAAKTGTSDWDSWLVAFRPNLTFVMWAGYDDNQLLESQNQTKVREVFHEVFATKKYRDWYVPNREIVQIPINLKNQKLDGNGSIFWFKQNTLKRRT